MSAPESTLSIAHGTLPTEDPASETVAAIAQAQTISAGTQKTPPTPKTNRQPALYPCLDFWCITIG